MKKVIILIAFSISISVCAQDTINHFFAIETDPAPIISGGYSASLKYSPRSMPKTIFMGSFFRSNLPDMMLSKINSENGWANVKIEPSFALSAEFYFNKLRKGFYVGPLLILYNKSCIQKGFDERIYFSSIFPNVRFGYSWYPFKKAGLYINPWLGIGIENDIGNNNILNGKRFEPNTFNYVFAVHLGYSFLHK